MTCPAIRARRRRLARPPRAARTNGARPGELHAKYTNGVRPEDLHAKYTNGVRSEDCTPFVVDWLAQG